MAITVDYDDVDPFPKYSFSLVDGFQGTRVLHCAWADRNTLAAEILAYPDNAFPTQYGVTGPVALKADVEGIGRSQTANTNLLSYSKAKVTVHYSDWLHPSSDYATEIIEPTTEYLNLDHRNFRWATDNMQVEPQDVPKIMDVGFDYVRIYHRLAAIPAAVLTYSSRNINNAAVVSLSLGITFPANTLLYRTPRIMRTITTGNVVYYRVTYRFTFKPNYDGSYRGWNYFPRFGKNTYEQMVLSHTGATFQPYIPADFSGLFP